MLLICWYGKHYELIRILIYFEIFLFELHHKFIGLPINFLSKVGQHPPEVGKDPHWDIGIPEELPYTVAALPFRIPNMETAAENLKIPIEQHRIVGPGDIEEADGNGVPFVGL